MRERRRRFTEDFKRDAVRLADKSPQPLAEVARSLGVGYATLHRWYDASMAKRSKKTASNVMAMPSAKETLEEENARLKRQLELLSKKVEVLESDREILKKAAAFFAKESE